MGDNKPETIHLIIGLHCNTRSTRELRTWSKFPEFCQALIDRYHCTLVFTGSADDTNYLYQIIGNVRGDIQTQWIGCSLDELIDLLKTFDLFITVNTFPMHLAIALKVKTLALIGGTAAKVIVPMDDPNFHFIEAKDLKVDNLTVEEVMERVNETLG